LDDPIENLASLLLVAMVTNSTGVVSVSMEIFNYGCLVTTASVKHVAILKFMGHFIHPVF
jgi:hypothetical protein